MMWPRWITYFTASAYLYLAANQKWFRSAKKNICGHQERFHSAEKIYVAYILKFEWFYL